MTNVGNNRTVEDMKGMRQRKELYVTGRLGVWTNLYLYLLIDRPNENLLLFSHSE